jgi:hypothetical protein
MNKSTLIASLLTVAVVLGFAIFRLLKGASVYDLSALGRSSILPKSWRGWLYDEHDGISR